MAAFVRERSPPRGDRRPLSKRNKSREDRAAAGGATDTYGQIRAKALAQRSKTVPAEVFIGELPKRAKAVPPNAAALKRRQARAAATKRPASVPADDVRVRTRGGPADAERAAVRQKLADNERLYQDKQGNIKSRRVAKTASNSAKSVNISAKTVNNAAKTVNRTAKTVGAKTKQNASPPMRSNRPEDKYGVRRTRAKSVTSRSRERIATVV